MSESEVILLVTLNPALSSDWPHPLTLHLLTPVRRGVTALKTISGRRRRPIALVGRNDKPLTYVLKQTGNNTSQDRNIKILQLKVLEIVKLDCAS